MAILKPDKTTNLGGVTVNEFLLTKHNPRNIAMPSVKMEGIIGVTFHNTDWIKTAKGTTPAEQYTRATYNGNMNDVRVHYYVDHVCAWQNLPLDLSGWHTADGSGNGNCKTIAIECIMSSAYNANDQKSEDNATRLAAALLKQYRLGIECLFTHTHWLSVKAGKTDTVDELNTMRNAYKMCPLYILPHWAAFKAKVAYYLNEGQIYHMRTAWDNVKSQTGAFKSLDNAKKSCKAGYSVFDENGTSVFTAEKAHKRDDKITLKNAMLFASSTAKSGIKKSGTFYLYDGVEINDGYRITTKAGYCGKTPIGKYVTGWVDKKDI